MDFVLILLESVMKAVVKVAVTALVKHAMSLFKKRTAPITSRDGSDDVVK